MAQNPLPQPPGALLVLAGKCKAGLSTYGTTLGITQVTPATLTTDMTALSAAINAFNAARAGRTVAHQTLNAASASAKTWLSAARGVMVAHYGETYSLQWAAAGWTDNSTAVPNSQPARLALVNALAGFLADNSGMEVSAGPIVFTAAQAGVVGTTFADALAGVGQADEQSDAAKDARTAADTTLRKALRALIGILNQKLTPNDARWAAFGLNAPGAAVTPSAPTGLVTLPALAGQVHLTCGTPAGTDHFRWFEKKAGETAFTFVTDTAEAELLLDGQASGTTVQFYVTAVNPAGESVPSSTVSVAVG